MGFLNVRHTRRQREDDGEHDADDDKAKPNERAKEGREREREFKYERLYSFNVSVKMIVNHFFPCCHAGARVHRQTCIRLFELGSTLKC